MSDLTDNTAKNQYYDHVTNLWGNIRGVDGATRILPYSFAVALGHISGHESFRGYGQRIATSTTTAGDDIWEGTATTCPIPTQPTGDLMTVVSTSAQDGVAGTGIVTLAIHYLDATGNPQSVVIVMNGITPVNTGVYMRFIQSIHAETVGTNKTAIGTILLYKTGDAATVFTVIVPGGNMHLNAARMVPLGKTFYMTSISVSGASNKSMSVKLRATSTFEDVVTTGYFFLFKDVIFLQNSTREKPFITPLKFPALTVVKATAYSTISGGDVTFSYDGWIE